MPRRTKARTVGPAEAAPADVPALHPDPEPAATPDPAAPDLGKPEPSLEPPAEEAPGRHVVRRDPDEPRPPTEADADPAWPEEPPGPVTPASIGEIVDRIAEAWGVRVEYARHAIVVHHGAGAFQIPESFVGCVELPTLLWAMLEKRRGKA